MDDSERTFLSRWSRRKALRQEELDETIISGTEQVVSEAPDSAEGKAPLPTDEDMPPIESLGEDDNYGDFLSPEVSEKLRKVALRKLFHGAGFNIRDGLDDYDEDFTFFEPLGDIVTADMRHREEMLERKAREAAEAAEKEQQIAAEVGSQSGQEPATPEPREDHLADRDRVDSEDGVPEDNGALDDHSLEGQTRDHEPASVATTVEPDSSSTRGTG
jgi:hypothetical protein